MSTLSDISIFWYTLLTVSLLTFIPINFNMLMVLIDDNIDNLLSSQYYDRVCIDYAWNRDVHDEVYAINRAHNWDEIVEVVDKLYEYDKEFDLV